MPTHARFGPMVLGSLLAFIVPLASAPSPAKSTFKKVLFGVLQVMCLGVMSGVFMTPPRDAAPLPPIGHTLVTVLLRNVLSLAAFGILYTSMVQNAPKWLGRMLSWKGWRVVASASYMVNMLHFRVFMELCYGPMRVKAEQVTLGYMCGLYGATLAITIVSAHVFHAYVEGPMRKMLLAAFGFGGDIGMKNKDV